MSRWQSLVTYPYKSGGSADAWLRTRLTHSRARWIYVGVLCYFLFQALAPFAAFAHPAYARILEGVAVAVAVTFVLRFAMTRARGNSPGS
jgi:hypothetical protein